MFPNVVKPSCNPNGTSASNNTPKPIYINRQTVARLLSKPNANANIDKITTNVGSYVQEVQNNPDFFSINTLDLSECNLSCIPTRLLETINCNCQITGLNLSDNQIAKISFATFTQLNGLRTLKLNRNQIETLIPVDFNELDRYPCSIKAVIEMNNYMELQTFYPKTFVGLQNLECLELSGNKISMLYPNIFDGLSNLKTLDLSENKIQGIYVDAFKGLSKLTELNLLKCVNWNNYFDQLYLCHISCDAFDSLAKNCKITLPDGKVGYPEIIFSAKIQKTAFIGLDN